MDKFRVEIVFQDDDLLVVNKPFGMVVNRADTTKDILTLQEWAEDKLQITNDKLQIKTENEFISRGGIVHRLDKDTSGLLIIAKNENAFVNLQKQFKERTIQKKYLALVHGEVTPKQGRITLPIERSPFDRKKFGVFLGGRDADTEYMTISNFKFLISNEKYSLLEVTPHTGRTHQIRVHLKHLGYPIVSDQLYEGRKILKSDLKLCPRMFLHAYKLEFSHPANHSIIRLTARLPDELEKVLFILKKY